MDLEGIPPDCRIQFGTQRAMNWNVGAWRGAGGLGRDTVRIFYFYEATL
jgi:hypothetical protein